MIELRIGDIFRQADLTHIAHQANLYHTFGAGIAREIARRFPYAAEADRRTPYGPAFLKLGSYTKGHGVLGKEPVIVNIYSQDGIGGKDRQTNYAALGHALLQLERELQGLHQHYDSIKLGIPHGFGCGLANGDWGVVMPIIESAFGKSPVPVVICRHMAGDDSPRPEYVKVVRGSDSSALRLDRSYNRNHNRRDFDKPSTTYHRAAGNWWVGSRVEDDGTLVADGRGHPHMEHADGLPLVEITEEEWRLDNGIQREPHREEP